LLLHPDQVIPWSLWTGTPAAYSHPDNLAAACYQSNSIKQDRIDGIDPLTGRRLPIFNPRPDGPWSAHFSWNQGYLEFVSGSAVGRATIAVLRLNRREYKAHRLLLRRAWQGGHDPWPSRRGEQHQDAFVIAVDPSSSSECRSGLTPAIRTRTACGASRRE